MKRWILKIVLSILLAIFANSCMSEGVRQARQSMNNAYSEITLEDGVNEKEAGILAGTYFTWYISGCGATGEILDKDDQWEIKRVIGVAAKPYDPIFVDKKTGTITYSKGLTVKAPKLEASATLKR